MQLSLDIDRMVTRDVPVHLAVTGPGRDRLHDFSRWSSTRQRHGRRAQPLRGAAHVGQDRAVRSEGADADPNASVEIDIATIRRWGCPLGTSMAKVNVAEAIADREFRAVDVEVKDSDFKYRRRTRSRRR